MYNTVFYNAAMIASSFQLISILRIIGFRIRLVMSKLVSRTLLIAPGFPPTPTLFSRPQLCHRGIERSYAKAHKFLVLLPYYLSLIPVDTTG